MARRTMALLPHWSSRMFSLELDGAPVYFSLRERYRGAPAAASRPVGLPPEPDRCFSLLVCGGDRIRKAKFYSELRDRLVRELPAECRLSQLSSFLPDVRGSLLRGYLVRDPSPPSSSHTEAFLRHLLRHEPVSVCSYSTEEDGLLWTQDLWAQESQNPRRFYMVASEAPEQHPSTLNIINSDVFYSFQDAYDVIKECGDIIPEATSVLERLPDKVDARRKPDFPVIVVEGLDATGKTTLTESLRDALGAALLRSPPQCFSPWRARFDQEPPLIRRAFYALGNYITALQIGQEGHKTPVIVDRFWHSTAAYAIATAVGGPVSNLPAEGSEVYQWPSDLLQPSLVVLLTLDPEERTRRLRDRGQGKTEEEQELDHNRLFRLRVDEAYQRIGGPECVVVDAGPSAEQVLQQVLGLIQSKCHL